MTSFGYIATETYGATEDCHVRLLSSLLRRFIRQGTLRVRDADGKIHVFGERLPGPDVAIHLHDRRLYTKLFINPELYAAEAYMDGSLTLEDGAAIHDFLLLFSVNRAGLYAYGSQKLMRRVWRGLRRWHQANPIGLAAAHRIAPPELLPKTGPLPHLICSRQSNLGSGDEEGEHGDTSGIDFGDQGALRLGRAAGKGKDSG
jgi:hypothetical protein